MIPWHKLTPEERKGVMIIRRTLMDEREREFYSIHGDKRNNHGGTDDATGQGGNVRQVSGRN